MTKPLPYALMLRKVPRDMRGRNNFLYPKEGRVTAPDWKPTKQCGHGLHGYLWGKGDASASMPSHIAYDSHGKWLVIKVLEKHVVGIKEDSYDSYYSKYKFKTGVVVFCGTRKAAAEFMAKDPKCPKEQTVTRIYKNFQGC